MERRRSSCGNSLPGSEAQIRLCPEKFEESSTDEQQKLPPVDGGFQAWMFLTACVMLEALIWGKSDSVTTRDNPEADYMQDSHLHSESSRNIITPIQTSRSLIW
jgi:hypothetical protein